MSFIPEKTAYASTANSSTSNIANGASFAGIYENVEIGSGLVLTLKADQDLTVTVEYSPDGVNTDSTLTSYYKTAQIEAPITYVNARGYVKVTVANNSGSATTSLRLDVSIVPRSVKLDIPSNGTMSQDYPSGAVRPTSFDDEVALGRRQGVSLWNKFGYNSDVDTVSPEVVASFGGAFARMTSADTLDIVSSDANDTSGGTGVNSVVVYGVDANRDEIIEVVTMNGTTTVTTAGTFLGVNRVAVFLSGTGETNAGTITVTATTAGSTQAEIPVGDGVTQQLIFHIPQNHTFLLKNLSFSVLKIAGGGGSPVVSLKAMVYSAVNNTVQEIWRESIDTAVENNIPESLTSAVPIGEKAVLYITAETDVNNTVVSGRFSGKLYRDADS